MDYAISLFWPCWGDYGGQWAYDQWKKHGPWYDFWAAEGFFDCYRSESGRSPTDCSTYWPSHPIELGAQNSRGHWFATWAIEDTHEILMHQTLKPSVRTEPEAWKLARRKRMTPFSAQLKPRADSMEIIFRTIILPVVRAHKTKTLRSHRELRCAQHGSSLKLSRWSYL